MAIVDTVSALDALKEKIVLLEEDLSSAKQEYAVLRAKGGAWKVTWKIVDVAAMLGTAVGVVFAAFSLFACFSLDGSFIIFVVAGVITAAGCAFTAMKAKILLAAATEPLSDLKKRIAELEADVAQAKDRKRKLLLQRSAAIEQEIDATEGPTGHQSPSAPASNDKECPMCAETVKAKAKICRFCRYEFVD